MWKGTSLVLLPFSLDLASRAFLLLRLSPAAAHQYGLASSCCSQPFPKRRMADQTSAIKGRSVGELRGEKPMVRKRRVVEHVVLFQMKEGFTEEQEKDMLDHLYTLQYQLRGILTVSLGSTINQNQDGCTHGLFMRFPSTEALAGYYDSPARWKVANEYIIPYYNGLISVDYEAEVEDDIEPLFRRGETFEQGVESLLLLQVKPNADPRRVQESFDALSYLVEELGMLVVQHTSGVNFCSLNKGYTHGMVTRFLSEEARDTFTQHSSYLEIMESKFQPITLKMLSLDYSVSPTGSTAF